MILKVDNLSFKYPNSKTNAIENINFTLDEASINMIIGPNGSGKSTLLKVILGILNGNGRISFFNNTIKTSLKKIHIGYVPQKLAFDTSIPITVNEFLQLTVDSCKRCKKNIAAEINDVLVQVQSTHLIDKKLGDLSGGQLQRIVIARALMHKPKLLILDEPEAGIDITGELFFYKILKDVVKKTKVAALIATHEMEVVHKYADQVLCINKTLVCAGNTTQALTSKTFEKLYGINNQPFNHEHNKV